MYAPSQSEYDRLSRQLEKSIFVPVEMHRGLDDVSMDDIIKMIVASASAK